MTQGEIPGLETPYQGPQTDDDWLHKRIEVSHLFSPTHPVKESELFAGRADQMKRIVDAIFQAGQHVVVYGDRGVGKTSLTNIMTKKVFGQSTRVRFFPTQCFKDDDFIKIWERAFAEHQWPNGDYAQDDIDSTFDPNTLLKMVSRFGANIWPVFIFDEFDRIIDNLTKSRMAESIKLLSDKSIETTIIIAGVGRTIRELISEHESTRRALKQIKMPRMSGDEIKDIINVRLMRAEMTIDPTTLDTMVWLSRGMPGYAHLLGLHAAKAAIDNKSLHIGPNELRASFESCLEEVGETTRHAYTRAIHSAKSNLLRQTLLACASVDEQDEFGSFTAAAIRKPLSKILGRERDIPDFNRHLNAFSEDRGPILEKEGKPKNYIYRFIDPMMQSYVIIQGLRDGLL